MPKRWTIEDALLAVFIGAIDANDHVSAEEAARAHHIIWSTRRFRRKSGQEVNRRIDQVTTLIEKRGGADVVRAAAHALPAHLRKASLAIAADLVLVDGKVEGRERRFLTELGRNLGLDQANTRTILDVIAIKNSV